MATPVYSLVQGDAINLVATMDRSVPSPDSVKFVLQRNNKVVFQKATGGSGIVVDDATQFTVTLNNGDTAELLGDYKAQALITDQSGNEKTGRLTDSNGNIVETITVLERLKFT